MTEVERIIRGGVISENFLQPETICDFYVDETRKKIWAIGIDLLVKFDCVCRKHGLKYSLAFGSLLGVVRHNGFIPWDDDIDVVMPRADYEKLKELKEEFESPYFFQMPGENDDYLFSFPKLRNSYTTGISYPFRFASFNQGLFLDIFPLDNYNPINVEQDVTLLKRLIAECSALMRRKNPCPDEEDLEKLSLITGRTGEEIVAEIERIQKSHESETTGEYICWCTLQYDYTRKIYKKEYFDNLIEVDFYGHKVFIPLNYKRILEITYGDYMQLPPVEKRGTWHSRNVTDPDVPYREYLNRLRE